MNQNKSQPTSLRSIRLRNIPVIFYTVVTGLLCFGVYRGELIQSVVAGGRATWTLAIFVTLLCYFFVGAKALAVTLAMHGTFAFLSGVAVILHSSQGKADQVVTLTSLLIGFFVVAVLYWASNRTEREACSEAQRQIVIREEPSSTRRRS